MAPSLRALACALAVASSASSAASASSSASASASASLPTDLGLLLRAEAMAAHLVECSFQPSQGTFSNEALWQSGNTVEALANLVLADSSLLPTYAPVFEAAYERTAPVVDNCYDDHQWWLLAWVRAYQATGVGVYLERAAQVHDFVTQQGGWDETVCGGGVAWCPPPTNAYKNAITNTLFLTASMELHPYAAQLGRAADYYLVWAQREADWLFGSGTVNAEGLLNDGLDSSTPTACRNNNGTTWTYNQGVLLDGLALLAAATGGNATTFAALERTATATMALLTTPTGVLAEPCTSCDGDQHIFKGIWTRHLGRVVAGRLDPNASFLSQSAAFLQHNALTMLANDTCGKSGYGILWQGGGCLTVDTATNTAAMDLLTAASLSTAVLPPTNIPEWVPIGLGDCSDAQNNSMPNCYNNLGITEAECAAAASADPKAVAYDFQAKCDGLTSFCRVRSLGAAPGACPFGWGYTGGSATSVTTTIPSDLTICLVRSGSGAGKAA